VDSTISCIKMLKFSQYAQLPIEVEVVPEVCNQEQHVITRNQQIKIRYSSKLVLNMFCLTGPQ